MAFRRGAGAPRDPEGAPRDRALRKHLLALSRQRGHAAQSRRRCSSIAGTASRSSTPASASARSATARSTSRCSRCGAPMRRISGRAAMSRRTFARARLMWRARAVDFRRVQAGATRIEPAARHGDHAQRHRARLHHRPHRRSAAQRGLRAGGGRSRRMARARQPSRGPSVARRDAARAASSSPTTRSRSHPAPARRSSRADNSITSSIRRPARARRRLAEVAVIAPRAMIADALATAICVVGEERAAELLAAYPGTRAVVTRRTERVRIR